MSGWSTRRPLTPYIRGGGRPPFRRREHNSPAVYPKPLSRGCPDGSDGNNERNAFREDDEIYDEINVFLGEPAGSDDDGSDGGEAHR